MAVGVLFAAATSVPAWSRMSAGHARLVPLVVLFAAVCWLNCVAIESWEGTATCDQETDALMRAYGERPHRTTRFVGKQLGPASLAIAAAAIAAALVGAVLGGQRFSPPWTLAAGRRKTASR